MKTILSTGPGMVAARSRKSDASIPANALRVVCARVEIYELDAGRADDELTFTLLPAMAENNPLVAQALLDLHQTLNGNLELLKKEAGK